MYYLSTGANLVCLSGPPERRYPYSGGIEELPTDHQYLLEDGTRTIGTSREMTLSTFAFVLVVTSS